MIIRQYIISIHSDDFVDPTEDDERSFQDAIADAEQVMDEALELGYKAKITDPPKEYRS